MHFLRPHFALLITALLTLLVGFAAANSQNNLLFWGFAMLASAVVISVLVAHLGMRSLEVRRLDPNHGEVGEPMVVQYAITNRSRILPVFNIWVREIAGREANWDGFTDPPTGWVMHIPPGETVHGEAVCWPRTRGEMRFDAMQIRTSFPFGIVIRTRRLRQRTHTLIFPRRYHLRRGVLDAIVPSGPLGMKLSNRPGGGDDYFGLREYKPGDSRRLIAWKRSAGADQLIVKERTLPSPPRLRVVLNLGLPTESLVARGTNGVSPRQLEERAIALTATFVDTAARHGYEVGLAVIGFDLPLTPLRAGHWHVEKIMGALASIDLDKPRTISDVARIVDAERAGVVVVHPTRIDPAIVRHAGWNFSAMQLLHLIESGIARVPEAPGSGGADASDGRGGWGRMQDESADGSSPARAARLRRQSRAREREEVVA